MQIHNGVSFTFQTCSNLYIVLSGIKELSGFNVLFGVKVLSGIKELSGITELSAVTIWHCDYQRYI